MRTAFTQKERDKDSVHTGKEIKTHTEGKETRTPFAQKEKRRGNLHRRAEDKYNIHAE